MYHHCHNNKKHCKTVRRLTFTNEDIGNVSSAKQRKLINLRTTGTQTSSEDSGNASTDVQKEAGNLTTEGSDTTLNVKDTSSIYLNELKNIGDRLRGIHKSVMHLKNLELVKKIALIEHADEGELVKEFRDKIDRNCIICQGQATSSSFIQMPTRDERIPFDLQKQVKLLQQEFKVVQENKQMLLSVLETLKESKKGVNETQQKSNAHANRTRKIPKRQ